MSKRSGEVHWTQNDPIWVFIVQCFGRTLIFVVVVACFSSQCLWPRAQQKKKKKKRQISMTEMPSHLGAGLSHLDWGRGAIRPHSSCISLMTCMAHCIEGMPTTVSALVKSLTTFRSYNNWYCLANIYGGAYLHKVKWEKTEEEKNDKRYC